jgi:hypothetical protein
MSIKLGEKKLWFFIVVLNLKVTDGRSGSVSQRYGSEDPETGTDHLKYCGLQEIFIPWPVISKKFGMAIKAEINIFIGHFHFLKKERARITGSEQGKFRIQILKESKSGPDDRRR